MAAPATTARRWPAEWEPHEATWLGFPANPDDWPGKLDAVEWAYAEFIRHLAASERVYLIVQGAAHERRARALLARAGVPARQVRYFRMRSDRNWLRDSGPITVETERGRVVAGFGFNAWAKYDNWRRDAKVAEACARALRLPYEPIRRPAPAGAPRTARARLVLEGGAIDGNGRGTLLTTEECLLHPRTQVRNPGLRRADYEAAFASALGATNVIWLPRGIAGDDTHGHVDDLARFVGPRTIVLCHEPDPRDPNHRPLREAHERLVAARLEDGRRPEVVLLPMPAPLVFDGVRLPASYANFYIANDRVLVPTFNDPRDRVALGILGELFPGRQVTGIHAVDLVWGFGTLHCLSQQLPAP